MRIYLDASPAIFYVQGVATLEQKVAAVIEQADAEVYASYLTKLESMILPMRRHDYSTMGQFEQFFHEKIHGMWNFDPVAFAKATEIRSSYNFRTPDALHLAVAQLNQCDLFLTNDLQLLRYPDIAIQVVEQLP